MAVSVTSTWARTAGLLPPVGKDWRIEIRLFANGKQPGPVCTSLQSTEMWLMIGKGIYWVDVMHGGKRDSISIWNKKVQRHYDDFGLPVPDLARFAPWVARFEKIVGKPLVRDKFWVQSNVKGGRDAIVEWVQNGYTFQA